MILRYELENKKGKICPWSRWSRLIKNHGLFASRFFFNPIKVKIKHFLESFFLTLDPSKFSLLYGSLYY